MNIRIEGLISKKVIKGWLDNIEGVFAGSPPDGVASSSGYRNPDGVSGRQLNKVMLEAAIADLPPVLYICLKYRWLEQLQLGEALRRTGLAKSTYYRRCDKAVDFIYYHVNGIAAGVKDLVEKIIENSDK